MIENKVNSTSSAVESQSNRSPWTQIVLGGESEPIMEKEKSDNSGLVQGNAEKKPVWNRPSNVDSGIRPVMGASSWPALSETTIAPPSNKSSSDSLKSLSDGSSSSSSVPPLSQIFEFPIELVLSEQMEQLRIKQNGASAFTNGGSTVAAQPPGQSSSGYPEFPLPYPFPRGQNQRNEFASQSHGAGNQNQYQRNSYKNQNGNQHPHQSHGGRRNQEHGNQNWNLHGNFNGRGGFAQPPRGTPVFVRHAPPPPPPPPMPPVHAQYMPFHQPFYPYSGPMVFPELVPSLMYHPNRMPFIEPPPFVYQFQDSSLETKIQNQVHYYFSEENLRHDEFLRKRMNDEGFVHIQFIAGFKKLKALTGNIQLILDALQGSDVVELKGYEIRNRHKWRRFLMPPDLREPFHPSPEYEMASKVKNLSLEPKANEIGSSSSNQRAVNNNSSAGSTLP